MFQPHKVVVRLKLVNPCKVLITVTSAVSILKRVSTDEVLKNVRSTLDISPVVGLVLLEKCLPVRGRGFFL